MKVFALLFNYREVLRYASSLAGIVTAGLAVETHRLSFDLGTYKSKSSFSKFRICPKCSIITVAILSPNSAQ